MNFIFFNKISVIFKSTFQVALVVICLIIAKVEFIYLKTSYSKTPKTPNSLNPSLELWYVLGPKI